MPGTNPIVIVLAQRLNLLYLGGLCGSGWTWERINTLTWGTNSSCCPFNGTNSHCCFIDDNNTEVHHKAKFDVIFQDNDLNMVSQSFLSTVYLGGWQPLPTCACSVDRRRFVVSFVCRQVGCRVPARDPATGKWIPQPGAGGMDTLETCLAARSESAGRLKAAAPGKAVLDYRGIVVAWWNYVTADHESWWLKGDTPVSVPSNHPPRVHVRVFTVAALTISHAGLDAPCWRDRLAQ
jgi:hypothetical protein